MKNQAGQNKSIAVTGMGCCSGAGTSVSQMYNSLQEKTVNCKPIPETIFQTDLHYPAFTLSPELLSPAGTMLLEQSGSNYRPENLNRTILLAIEATAEALQDAQLSPEDLQNKRVGIVLGTTVGCTFHDEDYYLQWRQGNQPDPEPVNLYLKANLADAVQEILGVKGPSAVITNACASGTDAIGIAREWLEQGRCDIALAGGSDALSRIAYYGFASLMLLSETPCKPFAHDRSGLNLGEGAGIMILEPESTAVKRNTRIQGWIRGYGAASDCYHPTAPHPEGRGLQKALALAMADAAVSKNEIAYVNAHGTGTNANDKAEMAALAAMELMHCPVMSTKSITGHMLGAAGAAEAILSLKILADQKTCGTINCTKLDDELARKALTQEHQQKLTGKTGISQSLAFGGTNSALVLEAN